MIPDTSRNSKNHILDRLEAPRPQKTTSSTAQRRFTWRGEAGGIAGGNLGKLPDNPGNVGALAAETRIKKEGSHTPLPGNQHKNEKTTW